MANPNQQVKGLIGWFATNHVAANLLMFFILGGGIYGVEIEIIEADSEAHILLHRGYPGLGRADDITGVSWDHSRIAVSAGTPQFQFFGPSPSGRGGTWFAEWAGRTA